MTMNENSNLILFLQAIGWSGDQINNFQLALDGKVPIEDAAEKHWELEKNRQ